MTIVVTGAAGFIGSHVTDQLLSKGEEVVGVDSFDHFYDPEIKVRNLRAARDHNAFTELRGDIRDPALYERLPGSVETVVHLAARVGVRASIADPVLYNDVNVTGTLLLLEWMRRTGVRNIVFASSSSVYGDRAAGPFSETGPGGSPHLALCRNQTSR